MKITVTAKVKKEVEIELPYFYKVKFEEGSLYVAVYAEKTYTIKIASRRNFAEPENISIATRPTRGSEIAPYLSDSCKSNRVEFSEARAKLFRVCQRFAALE